MRDLISRPATAADAPAIHGLIAAGQRRHGGTVTTALDGVAADLSRPTLDLRQDTLLLQEPGGSPVAWAWTHLGKRAHVHVHPGHEGRGIGTWLLSWTEQRAREAGRADVGQTVDDANLAAGALLRRHGYRPTVTQWQLAVDLPAPAAGGGPPDVVVRDFREGDGPATYRLVEDAFMDWQERRRSYAEWAALTTGRATFAPGLSRLALAGETVVGAVLALDRPGPEGHVERVAVDRAHRRRGIARVLLRETFAGFAAVGKRTCVLSTHSATGALSLYQQVGMSVRHSATHLRRPLPIR